MVTKMGTTKAVQLLVMSLVLLLLPSVVSAQATGSTSGVTGVVTDTTGAVVAGATVTLIDTKTSQERTTTTDDQGKYLFSQVQPGAGYKLTFTGSGFQTLELNLALGVGVIETHNIELAAGQVTETVTVTDQGGATLNTTDASIGNVIDERRLKELPIQFRASPAALIGLQPGAIGANVGTGAINRVGSVTGSRADQGNITVDGIDANDQATGQAFATTGNAPIDAIQEFRAVTANPGASEGRSSGGQVQLITKSGTNDFHGSLREFNRTTLTAANSFFNNRAGSDANGNPISPRPQLTRNQFGGSIGGPVYFPYFGEGGDSIWSGKDKLFFFYDFEARRDASQVTYVRTVPLAHVRLGQIAYLNNTPGCPTNARLTTHPQCISFTTPAQLAALDPQGIGVNQNLLNFINQRYPLPNDLSLGNGINSGGFRFNAPVKRNDKNHTGRLDWNITDRQRIFGRISKIAAVQTDNINSVAAQFPGDPETSQILTGDWAFAIGHNWVLTPNLVNSATVGLTKSQLDFPTDFAPSRPQSYTFSSTFTNPFAAFDTQFREVPVWTIRDDLSWTKGSHNLSFGLSIKNTEQRTNLTNDFNFNSIGYSGTAGNLTGFGSAAAGAALRPGNIRTAGTVGTSGFDQAFILLMGVINSVTTNFNYDAQGNVLPLASGSIREYVYRENEFYVADSWRARNDLTITAGVRWHIYPAPYEKKGALTLPDKDFETVFQTRIANGLAGISGPNATPLLTYDLGGKANNARPVYETDWNNFAPRLSFAWNPSFKGGLMGAIMGDRKTVIRGGGSVTYDRPGGGITFQINQDSYLFDSQVVNQPAFVNPSAALLGLPRFTDINTPALTNVAPAITRPITPTGFDTENYSVDPNFKIPYSISYSFGFQRELPGNFILEASYVGRQGRQLFAIADAAQIVDFRDPASGQFMIASLNNLQAQVEAGGAITPIAWFENQMLPAVKATFGPNVTCGSFGLGANCTQLVANFLHDLVLQGGTADIIHSLAGVGILPANVGLASQFGVLSYVTNKASSSYNGLLVSLRKRFSQGLQFDVNYTWSHSMDNLSTVANVSGSSGGLLCDATNLRVCRGPSDFDIRHLFTANGIWELPFGRGKRFGGDAPGWLNQIIGGWQISGIFGARSGLPFSMATAIWPRTYFFDTSNGVPGVIEGDRNLLRPSIHDTPEGVQFFADPAAAAAATRFPRHGETGNRNALRSTPYWGLDTLVTKNFTLPWSETQRLQIRWEAYNAFNHHAYGIPDSDANSATFGQVTTSQSTARVMQFGIRWDF
jgi:hypothetical protein